jgi:hypothetical protein
MQARHDRFVLPIPQTDTEKQEIGVVPQGIESISFMLMTARSMLF